MKRTRHWWRWLIVGGAFAVSGAFAQTYPDKPIRLIVPFTAGTGMDVLARTLSEPLARRMGQPIVVENKPGASGVIGSDFVAKSSPDGYTMMITANAFAIVPALYTSLPFDPVDDFAPIGEVAVGTLALVVHPSLAVGSVHELIARARRQPGKLNYASPGNGTPHHLAMELLKQSAEIDIVHIPYKGSAGAVTDVLGGQVPMMVMPVTVALPFATSGRLKVVAILSDKRSTLAPDVPTLREAGLENFHVDLWYGLLAPARTPGAIVNRLHQEVAAVLADAEIRAALVKQGLVPVTGTPEAFATLIRSDLGKWRKVVREAKITAD